MASPVTVHRDWLEKIPGQGVLVTPAALVEAEAFPTTPVDEILAALRRAVGDSGTLNDPSAFLFDPAGLGWPKGPETANTVSPRFITPESGPESQALSAAIVAAGSFPSPRTAVLGALRAAEPGAEWTALVIHDRDPAADATALLAETAHAVRIGRALGAPIVVLFGAREVQLIAPAEPSAWRTFPLEGLLSEDGTLLGALHMLIGERRLLSLPDDKRLPALLAASRKSRIRTLELAAYTVFQHAEMDLSPGINVLIGPNGSGKSHALKVLYAVLRGLAAKDDLMGRRDEIARKLVAVMRPDEDDLGKLVRWGARNAVVRVQAERGASAQLFFTTAHEVVLHVEDAWSGPEKVVYLPTREALSLYEWLTAAYREREIPVDETLTDLTRALGTAQLRSLPEGLTPILRRLEEIVGGEVILRSNRLYVRREGRDVEAPLLAEGIRKLAGLARLVANGSIGPGGLLIWDEPEGNLNPILITKAADLLIDLAKQGVQVIAASHDYLFVRHLSLLAEHRKHPDVPMRFFGFCPTEKDGVVIERGGTLVDLDHNPILDEFTRHVEREQALVFGVD
jgi:ABC-type transport system involved in cytochrome c biogenesis ATPase subunit